MPTTHGRNSPSAKRRATAKRTAQTKLAGATNPAGSKPAERIVPKPLHVYLGDHGRILATRPNGAKVAAQLREIATEPGDLLLDFKNVEVTTPPFLQEVLGALQEIITRELGTGRIVLLVNLNEDVAETLSFVLARRKQALAYRQGRQVELLEGRPQMAETLELAQQLRSFTAPELAARLDIKPDAATQRLRKLLEAGAVVREEDPDASRGIRHIYRAVTPDLAGAAR